jgi:hypothetical protein
MERGEVNADEIRDSVNSTGSLSLTDLGWNKSVRHKAGPNQIQGCVTVRKKVNESLQAGVILASSIDLRSAPVSCKAG